MHSKEVVADMSNTIDSGLLHKRITSKMPVTNGSGEGGRSMRGEERRGSYGNVEDRRRDERRLSDQLDAGEVEGKRPVYIRSMFQPTTLSLAYNRSLMKRPSVSVPYTDNSPSPMEESPVIGEDSYIPKIAEHTKSWPSFMARNYFHLNNIKLFNTFLINVILLMFQVSEWCVCCVCDGVRY